MKFLFEELLKNLDTCISLHFYHKHIIWRCQINVSNPIAPWSDLDGHYPRANIGRMIQCCQNTLTNIWPCPQIIPHLPYVQIPLSYDHYAINKNFLPSSCHTNQILCYVKNIIYRLHLHAKKIPSSQMNSYIENQVFIIVPVHNLLNFYDAEFHLTSIQEKKIGIQVNNLGVLWT
jgi:hypothetical protein